MSKNSTLIVKSNKLIEASYRLTANEQRVILKLASVIRQDDNNFNVYPFKINEFQELLGIKNGSAYKELKEITNNLKNKGFTIETDEKLLQINWLSSAEYIKEKGIVELEFSSKLKPYLLQLKSHFTSFRLEKIIKLRSFYSMRIYELLKQYEKIGERTFSIEDLRYMFQLQDEYPLYADFKRKVILQAQKDLNEKTDIKFEIEELKNGRKVEKIRFIIKNNSLDLPNEIAVSKNTDLETVKNIIYEEITDLEAVSILDAAKNDINIIREKYQIARVTKNIDNIVGWMKKAILEDYQLPKGKKSISTFNNYKQRLYDGSDGGETLESLEKKLLGWEQHE